jgi:hypothetical protein
VVRAWVEKLQKTQVGSQRLRQHFAALKFLYGKTLARPEQVAFLSWPKDPKRLPEVLTEEQVSKLLDALESPKYRVFFTTLYATGLRLREASHLQTSDIDAARGVIHVRHAKGQKERLAMLSPRLLAILRVYWKQERAAKPYLFPTKAGKPPRARRCGLVQLAVSRTDAPASSRAAGAACVVRETLRVGQTHPISHVAGEDPRSRSGATAIASAARYGHPSANLCQRCARARSGEAGAVYIERCVNSRIRPHFTC